MNTKTTPAAVAALGLLVAASIAVATPASAHNVVVGTTPEAGETLTQLPDAFSVTTSEPMLDLGDGQGFALQIRDAEGLYYGDGCVSVSGATLSAVPELGDPGEYTVVWQAVSEDGHTISGEIPFTWQPLGTVGKIATGYDTPPVCGEEREPVAEPTPGPELPARQPASAGDDLAAALWIGGGTLAAVIVVLALALRRRRA